MARIALNLITKNEEKNIAAAITSVLPEVDAVYIVDTGSTDKTVEIARSLGAEVYEAGDQFTHTATAETVQWVKDYLGPNTLLTEGDKLFRFHEARNYVLNLTPKEYDWVFWMDADDTLLGKEKLRQAVKVAEEQQATQVFFDYLYLNEFNPDGSIKKVLIEHLRERLFKNDGTYSWTAGIHETLIQQKADKKISLPDLKVVHHAEGQHLTDSIDRNIRNLEYGIWETQAADPRPIYYLAKAYYDLGDREHLLDAERLITKAYLKGSGWAEERGQAWEYVSWIRQKLNDPDNAILASLNSFREFPQNPSNFITMAKAHLMKHEFDKALFWVKQSAHVEEPETTLVKNPTEIISKALETIYLAAINLNMLDEAYGAAVKMKEIFPDDPNIDQHYKMVLAQKEEKDLTVKAMELAGHLQRTKQFAALQQFFYGLPQEIANNQIIVNAKQQVFPPIKRADNEIALWVGPGFELWSPKTIEEKGSGGSEEAVYRLSKEFAKIGYKVTVYANPGADIGTYDGVEYKNYYEMNWNDEFNILISWRRPDAMDMQVRAKKHYLWLHDVPQIREFTPERLENIDKVIVLSDFHASLLEPMTFEGRRYGVPSEKLKVSRNGVSI